MPSCYVFNVQHFWLQYMHGNISFLFDNMANPVVHLLLH